MIVTSLYWSYSCLFSLQVKGQYLHTVEQLNAEFNQVTEELRVSKNEHKVASLQVTELRKTLEEMRQEMAKQVRQGDCPHLKRTEG